MNITKNNLNKIYNVYNSGKKVCICNFSKLSLLIFGFLKEKNIFLNYFLVYFKKKKYIIVLINHIIYFKFYSKKYKFLYIKYNNIKNFFFYNGITIVSTIIGIIDIIECKKLKIGGKILFSII